MHPTHTDNSTDFLKEIYIHNQEILTIADSNFSSNIIKELIVSHSLIILCGHGSSNGLFDNNKNLVISKDFKDVLKNKNVIYLWCNANVFVDSLGLKGLFCGMYISEISEIFNLISEEDYSHYYDYEIEESNQKFAYILGKLLMKYSSDLEKVYKELIVSYGEVGKQNSVAKYNWERLYYKN